MTNFYDKLAKKLGGYGFAHDGLEYRSEYPNGNPEEEFLDAVIQVADTSLNALDIGCGDGIFAFRVADKFAHIDGIDNSSELIKIANEKQNELNVSNVIFNFGNASKMPYENASYDTAFNRRGPSFYEEYARVLKSGGTYIEIGIGEQDARPLKETFHRGQDFGEWSNRRIDRDTKIFDRCGLSVIRADDYFYKEFYPSRSMFEIFLEGVPIFEDFDKTEDSAVLEKYYGKYETSSGEIQLDRHRIIYILKKS